MCTLQDHSLVYLFNEWDVERGQRTKCSEQSFGRAVAIYYLLLCLTKEWSDAVSLAHIIPGYRNFSLFYEVLPELCVDNRTTKFDLRLARTG
mmetsp:Transcript_13958/g.39164  ORF Transcript_13958/g.39164 Transcript_13958/m.39164 type:complete len:92 (-) Transcript_13958:37-312(-)